MICLTIKDNNGNTLYEKIDENVELDDKDYENILNSLKDLDTDMVEFSLNMDYQNDNSHYLYGNTQRCGKTEMLKQCRELLKKYNEQVAALPVRHPLEHGATGARESVGSVDSVGSEKPEKPEKPADRGFVSAPTLKEMLSSDDEIKALNKAIGNYLKRTGFYEKPYDFRDFIKHQTSTFKGYCDDYNQQKLLDNTFNTIPGTYVGCSKHERCEKPSKRVKEDKEGNKEKCTEICKIEDFIDFLNTYDSWATLIQELQLHSKKQTQQGKTELINKYKKWKREQ